MFEGQGCGGGWGTVCRHGMSQWEEVWKGQDTVTYGLAVWATGWWPSTEPLMCLDGEVSLGSRQEHRSGCDVTPAGAGCFLWRGPSDSGAERVRQGERGSVPNAAGSFVCLCGQQLDWACEHTELCGGQWVSSYMLVIPDSLYYIT